MFIYEALFGSKKNAPIIPIVEDNQLAVKAHSPIHDTFVHPPLVDKIEDRPEPDHVSTDEPVSTLQNDDILQALSSFEVFKEFDTMMKLHHFKKEVNVLLTGERELTYTKPGFETSSYSISVKMPIENYKLKVSVPLKNSNIQYYTTFRDITEAFQYLLEHGSLLNEQTYSNLGLTFPNASS